MTITNPNQIEVVSGVEPELTVMSDVANMTRAMIAMAIRQHMQQSAIERAFLGPMVIVPNDNATKSN